jgi:hypothetical protein
MPDLPEENIIQLDQLRINRGLEKLCKCKKPSYLIDTKNRRVVCATCGAVVDPYEAIYQVAMHWEDINETMQRMKEQRQRLAEYKPWLKVIKRLEKDYRGHHQIPCCPRCGEPFYLEELVTWMGKPYADKRIDAFKEQEGKTHA